MLPSISEADLLATPTVFQRKQQRVEGTVLVAEDGEDNQQLISHLLQSVGAEVMLAPNGKIAYELAMDRPFDLILMDMQMPELDGYSAARKLRDNGYKNPIVALTAHTMADDRSKCLAAGCDDYLGKPIAIELLYQILGKYLKRIDSPEQANVVAPVDTGPKLRSGLASNDKFKGVLDRFVARLPERIDEMQRLLAEEDLENLGRAVHQLKGAAGGYGFPEITFAAGEAMDRIRQHATVAEVSSQVDAMIGLIRQVEGFPALVENVLPLPAPITLLSGEFKARVDPETGVATRDYLFERLSAEISFARRELRSLACIAIEIDQFELLQQQHSPQIMNAVAKRLAKLLNHHCQVDCMLFRAEPNLFVITAPRYDEMAAHALASQISRQIAAEPFNDLIGENKLSCLMGLSQLTQSTSCGKSLYNAALQQIVEAKLFPRTVAAPVISHQTA
jgi:CheY-like chemotaxis protein/GGDEF domain-containing protein